MSLLKVAPLALVFVLASSFNVSAADL